MRFFRKMREIRVASPTKGGISWNCIEYLKKVVAPGVLTGFPARCIGGLLAKPFLPAGTHPNSMSRWATASRGLDGPRETALSFSQDPVQAPKGEALRRPTNYDALSPADRRCISFT